MALLIWDEIIQTSQSSYGPGSFRFHISQSLRRRETTPLAAFLGFSLVLQVLDKVEHLDLDRLRQAVYVLYDLLGNGHSLFALLHAG